MSRNSEILVVDPDPTSRSLALLALRRDGLRAVGAANRSEALEAFESARPMMVISELELDDGDGLSLMRELRDAGGHEVPVLLLSHTDQPAAAAATAGADARALGAEDLLPKPLFARDLVTLSQIHRGRPAGARVIEGRLEKTSAAYLLRALATGSRSGRVIFLEGEGEVSFRNGRILDASFRHRCGEPALYRLLTLRRGPFHLFFEPVSGSGALNLSVGDLLRQGLPYVQRWEAITTRLPPLSSCLEIDFERLGLTLASLPDQVNGIVRLFDGARDIEGVICDSPLAELTTLEVIDRLLDSGVLQIPGGAEPIEGMARLEEGEAASDEVMRSLFGDGLPPGVAGAEALSPQLPQGWITGEPISWSSLEEEPVIPGAELEADPSAITGWDLPAALVEASRVAHAAAIEQGSDADLGSTADLGETLAPDFSEVTEAEVSEADEVLASTVEEPLLDDLFFDATAATAPTAPTKDPSLGWPAWVGIIALCGSLVVAAAVLTFGDASGRFEALPAPIVGAISPTPEPPPVIELEPMAVEAAVVDPMAPKDDVWLARELQAASDAYAAGDYDDAVLGYAGAAIERRDSLKARMGLGIAYLELGDLEGATAAFRAAREINPGSSRVLALLGSALQISGQRVEARKVYERYLLLHPEGAQATEIRTILEGWEQ